MPDDCPAVSVPDVDVVPRPLEDAQVAEILANIDEEIARA